VWHHGLQTGASRHESRDSFTLTIPCGVERRLGELRCFGEQDKVKQGASPGSSVAGLRYPGERQLESPYFRLVKEYASLIVPPKESSPSNVAISI
jgi:hypothetical protein